MSGEGRTLGHDETVRRELGPRRCHHAGRAPHGRVYVWRTATRPSAGPSPWRDPHPSSKPRRQPTPPTAPEPTADAPPSPANPNHQEGENPQQSKTKSLPRKGEGQSEDMSFRAQSRNLKNAERNQTPVPPHWIPVSSTGMTGGSSPFDWLRVSGGGVPTAGAVGVGDMFLCATPIPLGRSGID